DLPRTHYENQRWVLFNLDSPLKFERKRELLSQFQAHINWTMSYRNDSDIYVPYARFVKKPNQNVNSIKILVDAFMNKTREIAWFVNDCSTASRRENYVKELGKYSQVDIYGICGQFSCPTNGELNCFKLLDFNYKFYLSFEDSLCKDYVTENLYEILSLNVIPIIFGSADYKSLLPQNSYIDALAFKDPFNLSNYLRKISTDQSLIRSYLEWKQNFNIYINDFYFCNLCDKLNANEIKGNRSMKISTVKRNLVKWFYDESHCTFWSQHYI
ncbi:alpha-(1:3)-fucosyltransferase C-like protein, partial [Dinothrombium tinctorium]